VSSLTSETFGAYLGERIRESRLSHRKVGAAIGVNGRFISYLVRGERPASYATIKRLSDLLQFPLHTGLTLAGVPDEPEPVGSDATLDNWTVFELLTDLAERYRALQRQLSQRETDLPETILNDEQREARGGWIAQLDAIANAARAGGDTVAADAIASLAVQLDEQLERMESGEVVNGPHQNH
jgi:transcriptional regulator with XRE-family HTH domain